MTNIVAENWDAVLNRVKEDCELSEISFNTWIKPLKPFKIEDNVLTILVPAEQPVGLEYVERKYLLHIKVAVAEITGITYDIRFVLPENAEEPSGRQPAVENPLLKELNPKYTFDTFVVGNNNKFAHAAALAVAESPGQVYNPLFIYGGAGLGKTHLMNSIAHFIIQKKPETKILSVTGEEFTNEVIAAVLAGNATTALSRFRDKYRNTDNIDVLLIDDIQFIIGKDSTQEEFFHTFNALHKAGKQIVLSSDRPPKEMDILEERIRSRFEWGLMASIQSPDYETRMAILMKRQETEGFRVGHEILEYIASNVKSNIRELEGSLNKVIALATLEKQEITLDLAEKALADIISPDEKKIITPEYIINVVCEQYKITPEDIRSDNKSREISYPRQIIMYLCRKMTNYKTQAIATLLNLKNHTTIIHGVRRIENDYEQQESTRKSIDLLIKKINPQG